MQVEKGDCQLSFDSPNVNGDQDKCPSGTSVVFDLPFCYNQKRSLRVLPLGDSLAVTVEPRPSSAEFELE